LCAHALSRRGADSARLLIVRQESAARLRQSGSVVPEDDIRLPHEIKANVYEQHLSQYRRLVEGATAQKRSSID
jgi:hypothetical protein